MTHVMGSKGQIVIPKEIRERLGLGPGWRAVQRLVDDHVEVHFVPPEHTRSLKGSLAAYSKVRVQPGEEWDKAKDKAWNAAVRARIEAGKDAA